MDEIHSELRLNITHFNQVIEHANLNFAQTRFKGGTPTDFKKPVSDMKVIDRLKILGEDKTKFREWNDKLINALGQCYKGSIRELFEAVNKSMDLIKGNYLIKDFKEAMVNPLLGLDPNIGDYLTKDLWFILCEKTEGEANRRIKGAGVKGNGLAAYMRIYSWYAGTTSMALNERSKLIMNPTPPLKEENLADALDQWHEQLETLEQHGINYELNPVYKLTDLKMLMGKTG